MLGAIFYVACDSPQAARDSRQKNGSPKAPIWYCLTCNQRGNAGGLTPAMSSITRITWQL